MSAVLQVTNLSKKYISNNGIETAALKGLSFSIEENEMVAVMGSSGSGKTTLINILTGLMDADSGRIQINGRDYGHMDQDALAEFRRKEIGIVFQNYNLIDSLTVKENIQVPLILDQRTENQEEKVRMVAAMLGIEGELEKYPYEISGGQQQRAGICRAIIIEPKIIFADEPTGNLDAKSTRQVMEYFVKACKTQGASLLMVTHDPVAASYCDRLIILGGENGDLE